MWLVELAGTCAAAEALALAERHEARWSRGYGLYAVATHRWRVGEHAEAATLLREAVALRLADRTLLAFLLGALSGARVGEMRPYQAFDEQCADQARAALGADAFEAAVGAATGFGLDEATRCALAENPAPARRARATEPGGLTRREQEIAELVARGLSDKDIAATLVIGRRTVETHVENILAKLGFTSRTQVASWMTRQSP